MNLHRPARGQGTVPGMASNDLADGARALIDAGADVNALTAYSNQTPLFIARFSGASDVVQVLLDAGGRHYFAKDAHTTAAAIRRGYPRLDEWKAVRDSVDPHGVWQSDLSRRLGLTD